MKFPKFLYFVVCLTCVIGVLQDASADTITVRKAATFKYQLPTGPADEFDSPEEAVHALEDWQNARNPPSVRSALSNVRPPTDYPYTYNMGPIMWWWDYEFLYDNPISNYGGTTGAVAVAPRCKDPEWPLVITQDTVVLNNYLVRCEKSYEIPINPPGDGPGNGPEVGPNGGPGDGGPDIEPGNGPDRGPCNRCPCANGPSPGGPDSDGNYVGKPILPASGDEFQTETDYADASAHGLRLTRISLSSWARKPIGLPGPMGRVWRHNHTAKLTRQNDNLLTIDLPGGGSRLFVRDTFPSVGPWQLANGFDTLTQTANGWILHLLADDSVLAFNADGVLQSVTRRNGRVLNYSHDASGRIAQGACPKFCVRGIA